MSVSARLDVLVGNAAILERLSPLTHIPSELWDKSVAINVTANWRLVRSTRCFALHRRPGDFRHLSRRAIGRLIGPPIP